MNTLNTHLHLEQFLLRDNSGPTEKLLHNKGEREREHMKVEESYQRSGISSARWVPMFTFPLQLDSAGGVLSKCSDGPTRLLQWISSCPVQNSFQWTKWYCSWQPSLDRRSGYKQLDQQGFASSRPCSCGNWKVTKTCMHWGFPASTSLWPGQPDH